MKKNYIDNMKVRRQVPIRGRPLYYNIMYIMGFDEFKAIFVYQAVHPARIAAVVAYII